MKIKIEEILLENVDETLQSPTSITLSKTLEESNEIYTRLDSLTSFSLEFLTEDNLVIGKYTNKKLKKMEYQSGVATFVLDDVDSLVKQVEQNSSDIEYIRLIQDL